VRIERIETIPVRIPLKPERRMVSALGKHDVSEFLLVRVFTDDGYEGVGEATVTPRWSGETVFGAKAMIDHVLSKVVIGCDPAAIADIDERMDAVAVYNWCAKSALEMACWDIQGRAANKPVYELLGGLCRPLTMRCRFSMGAYDLDRAKRRASELVAQGFTTIKIKVGTNPTADIERVRAVREVVGSGITLTIDANGGWNEADALHCLGELADCQLDIVEQPLPRGNYTGLARLRQQSGVKILADESCFDEVEAEELFAHNACDALSLYPGKNGGIRKTRLIAEMAARQQIPCSIGSNLEWDVGAAAMMHCIVATPNLQVERYPGDCLGPDYHEFSIAKNPLKIEGPLVTLHEAPGLGIEVDWDLVQQHRIVDSR